MKTLKNVFKTIAVALCAAFLTLTASAAQQYDAEQIRAALAQSGPTVDPAQQAQLYQQYNQQTEDDRKEVVQMIMLAYMQKNQEAQTKLYHQCMDAGFAAERIYIKKMEKINEDEMDIFELANETYKSGLRSNLNQQREIEKLSTLDLTGFSQPPRIYAIWAQMSVGISNSSNHISGLAFENIDNIRERLEKYHIQTEVSKMLNDANFDNAWERLAKTGIDGQIKGMACHAWSKENGPDTNFQKQQLEILKTYM